MLEAFKLKPYDLEPVFASWTDGPIFKGNPKKDMPVEEWLDKIEAGCKDRKIPEEYWYKVAQHFLGPKAKARLDELKAVIVQVHGGKYRWSWKKFRVAMQSMGWGIDKAETETIKVSKTSGSWWSLKKKVSAEPEAVEATQQPAPSRSGSSSRRGSKDGGDAQPATLRRAPTRSASDFWPVRRNSKDESEEPSSTKRPAPPQKSASETALVAAKPPIPSRSNTVDSAVTTITQAPVWLLNACNALEYITSEHPKAMSIISAILITAGSIPAIPAISAGAGGAVLASGAAHAIGAIAIGLGQAIGSTVKVQNQNQGGNAVQAPTTVR
ncbi:hypothetical protein LshimejAT787_1701800 [Lyophyllum shimeji]|uniref:Uncharacterized protein n=1 Tax=Lyophyllum shimeji TaxID=47721 RepID=A0A9P3PZT3_LYOSH|nr:hypothetical protein LshimejAT787_1701800 [Lyophyllum shimeji]